MADQPNVGSREGEAHEMSFARGWYIGKLCSPEPIGMYQHSILQIISGAEHLNIALGVGSEKDYVCGQWNSFILQPSSTALVQLRGLLERRGTKSIPSIPSLV